MIHGGYPEERRWSGSRRPLHTELLSEHRQKSQEEGTSEAVAKFNNKALISRPEWKGMMLNKQPDTWPMLAFYAMLKWGY